MKENFEDKEDFQIKKILNIFTHYNSSNSD